MTLVTNEEALCYTHATSYLITIVILKKLFRKVCQLETFFLPRSFSKTPERKSRVKEMNTSVIPDKREEGIHQASLLLIALPSAMTKCAFSLLCNTMMNFSINLIFLIFVFVKDRILF